MMLSRSIDLLALYTFVCPIGQKHEGLALGKPCKSWDAMARNIQYDERYIYTYEVYSNEISRSDISLYLRTCKQSLLHTKSFITTVIIDMK